MAQAEAAEAAVDNRTVILHHTQVETAELAAYTVVAAEDLGTQQIAEWTISGLAERVRRASPP